MIDFFSKFGWKVLLKNKISQTIKNFSEIILMSSKRKTKFNSIFQNFSNRNHSKHFSRNSSLGAVSAERFYRTIRDLLKRPVVEKNESNWVDVWSVIAKQNFNPIHTSTKLTPIQASLKKNERYVNHNLLDKRK